MYDLKAEHYLDLTHHQDNETLNKLIKGSIRRKNKLFPFEQDANHFWKAEQFLLNRSSLFKKLNEQQQYNIIHNCNEMLMNDFYFLEKCGLAYCARMLLLGETTEIRQLYGLMASDEAMHLEWFTPFIQPSHRTLAPQGKLPPVLGKIMQDCDANSLYYLVQIIVEGWSFFTYRLLAESCQSPLLKKILKNILRDEALHHKAGPALFDVRKIDKTTGAFIYDKMLAYSEALRTGPQMVIKSFEKELGDINSPDLEILFEELETELTSMMQLQLMKNLMTVPGMESYVERLKTDQVDVPYSAATCAKIYVDSRGQS